MSMYLMRITEYVISIVDNVNAIKISSDLSAILKYLHQILKFLLRCGFKVHITNKYNNFL